MILGHIDDNRLKDQLPNSIWNALAFVRNNDWNTLEDGIHAIDGDQLFINIMTVETVSIDSKSCEVHQNYADIQFIISGEEQMQCAASSSEVVSVTKYDAEIDFQSVNPVNFLSTFVLQEGMFAVFFPNEPHKPTCFIDKPKKIRKAVLKIHSNLLYNVN